MSELRRAGFLPEWRRVETVDDYIAALHPDLDVVISDFALPEFNGLRALDLLRQRDTAIPFIIVSGVIGEETVAIEKSQRLCACEQRAGQRDDV